MDHNPNNTTILHILRQIKDMGMDDGRGTLEITNFTDQFIADSLVHGIITIPDFSTDPSYINREIEWYESGHNKVDDIKHHASMWGSVADENGFVNSNYGGLIYSPQNCYQFNNVANKLLLDPSSRQAVMVYCPNHIHHTGGKDYVCTMYVQYLIRNNTLSAYVSMRSNDLRFGLVGADLYWQIYVLHALKRRLLLYGKDYKIGVVHWHAVSLHLYKKHQFILDTLGD